jgi:hypothetical protein
MVGGGGMIVPSVVCSGLSGVAAWLAGVLREGEEARLRIVRSPCRMWFASLSMTSMCEVQIAGVWLFGCSFGYAVAREALLHGVSVRRSWRDVDRDVG